MRHRKPRALPAPLAAAREVSHRLAGRGRRQRRRPLAPAVLLIAPGVALAALGLSPQASAVGDGPAEPVDTSALADLVQTSDLAGIPLDRPALSGRKVVTVRAQRGTLDSATAAVQKVLPPPAKPKPKPPPRLPARASRSLERQGAGPADAGAEVDPSTAEPRAPRSDGEWSKPAVGRFTSGYGYRWGRMHRGIDIAAPYGSPIYAAGDGVVTKAGRASGYGKLVLIEHADGFTTAYGHMSKILVDEGERVQEGELIARVGNEGHSTGNHLHFEVRTGDGYANPRTWLRNRGVRV